MLATPMLTSLDLVAVKAFMEAGAPQPTVNENRTKSSGQNLQQCRQMTTPLQLDENWASHPKGLSAGRDRNTMRHSIKGQSRTVHPFDYLINLSVWKPPPETEASNAQLVCGHCTLPTRSASGKVIKDDPVDFATMSMEPTRPGSAMSECSIQLPGDVSRPGSR